MSTLSAFYQDHWTRRTEFTESCPKIEAKRLAANAKLCAAGPVFLNDRGESVGFNDLDFGRQVGFLMSVTFPVDPPEFVAAYKKCSVLTSGEGRALAGRADEGGRIVVDREVLVLGCGTHSSGSSSRNGQARQHDDEEEHATPVSSSRHSSEHPDELQEAPGPTTFSPTSHSSALDPPLPTPYEIVAYTDDTRAAIRRRQPSIERNWHASKCQTSLSQQVWDELGGEGAVFTKRSLFFGPRRQGTLRSV